MQKRVLYIAFLLLAICNQIVAEDQISISDFSLSPGDSKEVSVVLANEDTYVGFQFDLYLPDGITVESFSANTNRFPEGTTPQMAQQSDGSYRLIAAALNGNPIIGNEGAVLTIVVKAGENVSAKDYQGYLRNVKISKADGSGVTKAEQPFAITVQGAEAEPYAVLSNDGKMVTFYYDNQRNERGGIDINNGSLNWPYSTVTTAAFDASFADYRPISTEYWFYDCSSLTSILGIENLKTDNVTNMSRMFASCNSLTTIDVSGFKTDNMTEMGGVFEGCSSLTTIDVSGFNTENVTGMGWMFAGCSSLTNLDVSGFKTDNVTNMEYMFAGCSSLTNIDVSGFKTDNVAYIRKMFEDCSGMTSIDISGFKTDNVVLMESMFDGCSNLTTIYVGNGWSTAKVEDGNNMFNNCTKLVGGAGTTYDSNHTDYTYARIDGGPNSETPGYFTDIADTTQVATERVATPTFSWRGDELTISTETEGATINYTLVEGEQYYLVGGNGEWNSDKSQRFTHTSNNVYTYILTGGTELWFAFGDGAALDAINDGDWTLLYGTTGQSEDMTGSLDRRYNLGKDGSFHVDGTSPFYRFTIDVLNKTYEITPIDSNPSNVQDVILTYTAPINVNSDVLITAWAEKQDMQTSDKVQLDYPYTAWQYLLVAADTARSVISLCEGNPKVDQQELSELATRDSLAYNMYYERVAKRNEIMMVADTLLSLAERLRSAALVAEPEPYAVLSDNNTVLTFYYDGNKAERKGMDINSRNIPVEESSSYGTATTAVFDASFADYRPTSTANWFMRCSSLNSITGMENLKTDNVTDMSCMFAYCNSLEKLDFSGFKTENVTDMSHMFDRCFSLTSLDLSNFRTDNVTDMSYMFEYCTGLTSLNVSSFNTANVTDMSGLFYDCEALTNLDVTNFNTENVVTMSWLFMDCSSLSNIDVTHFNTANVTDMSSMFSGCSGLTSLDVSNLKTDNVKGMDFMFYGCSGLTTLDIRNFETSNVTNLRRMFGDCKNLASLDMSSFNTGKVKDMWRMFYGCSAIESLYVGNGWSTTSVTNGTEMFGGCTKLVGGAGTTYDANHTDYTYAHIDGGSNNPGYFTDKNASEEIAAPTFRFEGDSLFIETATKDASIFYQMADLPNMDEATIKKISESLIVTADAQQSIYYEQPIELKKSVVLKAIAVGTTNSEISTLVYDYDAWQKLLEALDYGMDVSGRASDNSNVPDEMKEQLNHMLEEGKWGYYERMWNHNAVYNFTNEIMQLAHQMDEMMIVVVEPEPYAVLSENNTVLTFYYDDQKSARGGMSVGPFTYDYTQANMPRWSKDFTISDKLTTVIFDDSFASYKSLKSTAYWFYELRNLKTIIGIENVCTDSVTDMRNMFYFCSSLINLDLSSFKTDNVTNMGGMFMFCEKLASLNVSSFNTGNVVDMQSMFNGIIATSLDLSGFNTEKVTDMSEMFAACRGLEHLDLSNFNTSNVTNFNRMFWSSYNLKSLDLSLFTTGSVTDCRYMFSECSSLKTIYIGENWIFPSDFWYGFDMFADCANLVGGAGTVYDANHVDYTYARIDGGPSNPGYFTDKNAQADDGLELYAIDVESEMKSNETFMPTQSVKMTLGNDSEWSTNNDLAPELGGELKFDANIYYPGIYNKNYAFVSSVVGTNNPAAGPLVDGMSTGSSYKPRWRNLPESGAYFIFESEQDGSLIVPIRINPNKPLYVTDDAGVPLIAYQLKDQDGVTVALDANSSTAEKTIAFLSLNVSKNQKYYIFCKGSKPRVGGYIFAPHTIDIDPATTAAALDSLLAEPVDATFDSNGVLSAGGGTTMADALEYVGGRAEVAKTITAIVWNSTATLTNDDLQGLNNPNMLIYVKDAAFAPANRDNVVIGDLAKNIVLADVESGNNNFYCPQEFTAEMISYTHEYRQQTEIGVARGWETIALPFTVQTITHEKNGVIAPFGNDASGKHFWLRQLTQQGLAQARQIEANTPYLISMPNNNEYPAEFIQAGRVTFSSQNTVVPVTQLNGMEAPTATGGMVMIQPNFKGQSAMEMIYTLNVGEQRDVHPEGSIFVANYRSVRPFEAFTVHHGDGPAPQFISVFEMNGGTTGIEDVRGLMSDGRSDNWYTIDGRKLQQKPTRKGVYILNGQKKVVR